MEEYLKKYENYKLCYVDGGQYRYELVTLYFTNLENVTEQWGDDWNDAPYEHNAGAPYTEIEDKPVDLMKVKMYLDYHMYTPCTDVVNSHYTVEDINKKVTPWLSIEKPESFTHIFAGETLKNVIDMVRKCDEDAEIFILMK